MKLYFLPGACSLAVHMVLLETETPYELDKWDPNHLTDTQKSQNPKGYVPALVLDNGEVLTEAAVILQYLADLKPEKNLIPPVGTMERIRCQEWLNFIATELHKGFGVFFWGGETLKNEVREIFLKNLKNRMTTIDSHLKKHPFLCGEQFSVADIYLFVVQGWNRWLNLDFGNLDGVSKHASKIGSRAATLEALKKEESTK